jgi:glutaredoxin-like protein NrdH
VSVVTIYTKPACVQCNATYRALDKQGIAYETVDDVWQLWVQP